MTQIYFLFCFAFYKNNYIGHVLDHGRGSIHPSTILFVFTGNAITTS